MAHDGRSIFNDLRVATVATFCTAVLLIEELPINVVDTCGYSTIFLAFKTHILFYLQKSTARFITQKKTLPVVKKDMLRELPAKPSRAVSFL